MVGSITHKGLKRFFEDDDARKLPPDWSITVRANWRITFRFEHGAALQVNFEDYHEQ